MLAEIDARRSGTSVGLTMKNFQLVAKCPEVLGAVVGDAEGALIESSGDLDAESAAAVLSYATESLRELGERLGLGAFGRAVVTSPSKSCVVSARQDGILGVFVDATKPVTAFEKKMDELLRQ
jgi:predicted regulator of Ras-like GTPase activity (Roadblock/LC7/MglB family)